MSLSPGTAPSCRRFTLDRLPPDVRQRVEDALTGMGPVLPLMEHSTPAGDELRHSRWVAIGGLGLLIGMAWRGFASLDAARPFHQSPLWGLGYMAACAILAWGLLGMARAAKARGTVSIPNGVFAFASHLVRVDWGELEIHPMEGLKDLKVDTYGNGVIACWFFLETSPREIALPYEDASLAELERQKWRQGREQYLEALQSEDKETLDRMNPFFRLEAGEGWEGLLPEGPAQRGIPGLSSPFQPGQGLKFVLSAALLGMGAWGLRNVLSDWMAFRAAKESNTVAALRRYAAGGWLRAAQVRTELMPKAALGEALAARTAAALRSFILEYPASPAASEAKRALDKHFDEALSSYQRMAGADSGVQAFATRIFEALKAKGSPAIQVEFLRVAPPPDKDPVERIAAALGAEPVASALPGSFWAGKEGLLFRSLQAGFSDIFKDQILTRETAPPNSPSRPVLKVAYVAVPNGRTFKLAGGKRTYLELAYVFSLSLTGGDGAPDYRMEVIVNRDTEWTFVHKDRVYLDLATMAMEEAGLKAAEKVHRLFLGTVTR